MNLCYQRFNYIYKLFNFSSGDNESMSSMTESDDDSDDVSILRFFPEIFHGVLVSELYTNNYMHTHIHCT